MIQLIPLSKLNEECFLSLNVDEKKYAMLLKLAQMDLRDILGNEFYTQIETQFNGGTLSTDNATLFDNYIVDFLAWQTYLKYMMFANVEATPSGLRTFNDENSSIASDFQMYSLEKNVQNTANQYKFSMINFLKESQLNDSSKYSLWEDECRDQMSFAITAVDKKSDSLIRVSKTIITNE